MKPKATLRSFLLGSISLAVSPLIHAANTWDGGGGSGFWNTDANWNLDTAPSTGVARTFAGNVQNSTSNDLVAVNPSFAGILFTNSGAANNTNAFTLAGSRITLGGDITTTANTAGATITDIISLNMILNGNRTITTNQQSATVQHNLTISGIISEDVAGRTLTKAGAGTLTLSGNNSYTGGTSINGGTLIASHTSALGSGAVTMAANTVLRFGVSATLANNISMASGSTLAPNIGINPTYGGTITLSGTNSGTSGVAVPSTAVAFSAYSGGDTQTFNNPIGGTGDVAFRGGGAAANHNHNYILKGSASTYTGNTWLYTNSNQPNASDSANVVLQLQGGALPSTTVLTMTQNNGNSILNNSVLDLNGNNQTLAGLTTFTINTGGRGWFVSNTHASAASTLTINNTGNFTFAGVIGVNTTTATTGQAAGTNNIALVKQGAGIQTLSGANTYTGPTTLTGGTLKAGVASVANVSGAFGKNSAVTLNNTAGVILDITGFATQIGSLTGGGTLGGNVTLGAATLTVGGDNTSPAAYAGVISGAGGGVTKIGTGTLALSGANTYTGQTTVSAGTLTFAGSSSGTLGSIQVGGAGTATLNIQAGNYTQGAGGFFVGANGTGIVDQTGGAVSWNNSGLQLLIGNGGFAGTYNLSGGSMTTHTTGTVSRGVMLGVNTDSSATFNLSGTGNLTVNSTNRLMIGRSDDTQNNTTSLFSQSGGTATISGLTIGGGGANAATARTGNTATMTLTGGTFTATNFFSLAAAHSDNSTINIGGTAVVTLPNLPTARGSGATATLNFDGGTLRNSATGTFITGLTNAFIEDGGATFDTSLNSTTISQNLLTHGSSLGGGLTKIGTNTLTLSGTNTYTGNTLVNGGNIALGNALALQNSAYDTASVNGGLNVTGFATPTLGGLTGSVNLTSTLITGFGSISTLTLNPQTGITNTYSGDVGNGNGSMALTKTGAGTQVLSGVNTYTGATNVNAGKLLINGSTSTSSAVTVANGATLGGSGAIGGSVTVQTGGTFAPGNSIESIATGNLALLASAVFAQEIDKSVVPDISGDLAATTGSLSITSGTILTLNELGTSGAWGAGDTITLIGYSTGTWNNGLFTYLGNTLNDDSTFTFSGIDWTFDYNDLTAGDNYNSDLSAFTASARYVTMTAVPEPRAALLGGIGMLMLLRRRRG